MIGGCHTNGPLAHPQAPPQGPSMAGYNAPQTLFSLHQQASMYATPISPMFGASNDLINGAGGPMSQLVRSKSLNDISNDSQILAFASDRSIHNLPQVNGGCGGACYAATQQQQQQHLMNCNNLVDTNLNAAYYEQTNSSTTSPLFHNNLNATEAATITHVNDYATGTFMDVRCAGQPNSDTFYARTSPIDSQCSNKPTVVNATTANIFSVCNPIVTNLNGVTEQIGNLHL